MITLNISRYIINYSWLIVIVVNIVVYYYISPISARGTLINLFNNINIEFGDI